MYISLSLGGEETAEPKQPTLPYLNLLAVYPGAQTQLAATTHP